MQRRGFKQTYTLSDRLAAFAGEAQAKAAMLPPGAEREVLLKKVRQADLAIRMDDLSSTGARRSA